MPVLNLICNDAFTNCQISIIICLIVLAVGIGFIYLQNQINKLKQLKEEEEK